MWWFRIDGKRGRIHTKACKERGEENPVEDEERGHLRKRNTGAWPMSGWKNRGGRKKRGGEKIAESGEWEKKGEKRTNWVE